MMVGRSVGYRTDYECVECHGEGVEHEEPIGEQISGAYDVFYHLRGLECAYHSHYCVQDAVDGARESVGVLLSVEDVAVGGCAGKMSEDLSGKSGHGSVDVWATCGYARVVDEEPGREIVSAVHYYVIAPDKFAGVVVGEKHRVRLDAGVRVYEPYGVPGGVDLRAPEIGCAVHDLALQVAERHGVRVNYAYGAHSGCGKIEGHR